MTLKVVQDLLANFLEEVNQFLDRNKLEGEKIRRMQQKVREKYRRDDGIQLASNAVICLICLS